MPRTHRYCEPHALEHSRRDARERGTSYQRGYSDPQWRALRDYHVDSHPNCAVCGEWVPREQRIGDHIVPHRGDEALRLNPKNVQTLCRSCHGKKTRAEGPGYVAPRATR